MTNEKKPQWPITVGICMVREIGKAKEKAYATSEEDYRNIENFLKKCPGISTTLRKQAFDTTIFYELNLRYGPYKALLYSCPAIPVLLL